MLILCLKFKLWKRYIYLGMEGVSVVLVPTWPCVKLYTPRSFSLRLILQDALTFSYLSFSTLTKFIEKLSNIYNTKLV